MLSLYEILKASKTGIAPDMRTALAGMNWGGADSGHEVKELTGIPPLSIRSNGTMLLDYLISGNMSQTGTPTTTTPIQPQETGDLETVGVKTGQYKIPISSAGQTTPIYLGEVETTRKIKKLVLTGEENTWIRSGAASNTFYFKVADYLRQRINITICSHYTSQANIAGGAEMRDGNVSFYANAVQAGQYFYVRDSNLATVADLKSYLAAQYAAGTPVTVWYVLATEKTAVVNEPLRKIGDYADTVSYEQSGVQIPTLHGNTVIDVETTLKPSQMYIKYQE
jgi:hypothetical protein